MLQVYLISSAILFILCIITADAMTHRTSKPITYALIIIMVGDVITALCALYGKLSSPAELIGATILTFGISLWLYSERRTHDPLTSS